MRSTFYTTDPEIEEIVKKLSGMLAGWGLRGTNNDVIRYALYYTAERHGVRQGTPGRPFRKSKGGSDGESADGQNRQGAEEA